VWAFRWAARQFYDLTQFGGAGFVCRCIVLLQNEAMLEVFPHWFNGILEHLKVGFAVDPRGAPNQVPPTVRTDGAPHHNMNRM
jgi:hypothetical protein